MIYIILIIFLICSGFFSSLETGLLALGDIKIRAWSETKIRPLEIWLKEPTSVITAILVGNNIVNIGFSTLFTVLVVKYINILHFDETWIEPISIVLSSLLILGFGEILPKTFAKTRPDSVVASCFNPFMKFYNLISEIVKLLNKVSFSMIGSMRSMKEKPVSREEVHVAIDEIEQEGILAEDSTKMLENVLFMTGKSASQVMIPRENIFAVDISDEPEKILKEILACRYSRIPVYEKNLDNVVGVLLIKELLSGFADSQHPDLKKLIRPAFICHPDKNCFALFHDMRKKKIHCSIVMSNNRILGLVAMEDLIEEIVGEIYDEYDSVTFNN